MAVISGYDAGKIEAALSVDRSAFNRELDAAKADADKFSRGTYQAKLKADSSDATRKIDEATARGEKFGASSWTATARVRTDSSGLAALNRSVSDAKKNADGLGTAFSKVPLLVSGIAAVLPGAISLTGVLAGGVLAVGGAFASAGIAAAAFGAVAKPLFTQTEAAIKKVTAAQLALSKATTPASRLAALKAEKQALDQLTPSELKLYASIKSLQGQWKQLNTVVQPDVWRAVAPFIQTAETSIGLLPAVVRPASLAVHDIGAELQQLMSSGTTQQFAQFIGGTGSASLRAGGSFLVSAIKTVEELLPQFAPLIQDADRAIVNIGTDMARWAAASSTQQGIGAFIAWIRANAPVAEAFLKNLGAAVINLGKAFAAGGIGELQVLSGALKVIAELPPAFLTPIVTGLTAIALLSKVSVGASLLNGLGKLALSASGITAAGEALKGFTVATEGANIAQKALLATEVAVEAINPVAWAVAGAAAIAALGYVLVKNGTEIDAYVAQLGKADKATGYNIAGYQKLARQLNDSATAQTKLGSAIRNSEGPVASARDGTAAWSIAQGQVNQAQRQAQQTASKLGQAMSGLGTQYGITERSAIGLAKASGVSATAWTGSAKAVGQARSQVEQYVITNDKALPRQQETNALIQAMGSDARGAAGQISAMNTAYRLFVGDLISKQQALETARQSIQSVAQQIRTTGLRSTATEQQIQAWIQQLPGLAAQLGNSGTALSRFIRAESSHIQSLLRMHGLSATERSDLQGTQRWLDSVAQSQRGLTSAQKAWVGQSVSSEIPTLKFLGANTSQVHQDMDRLAGSIVHTGTASQSTRDARQRLIADLKQAGATAQEARQLVNQFSAAVHSIPSGKTTDIKVVGDGSYVITGGGAFGNKPRPVHAKGGLITQGRKGVDDQVIMVQKGELVVPEPMVSGGAVDHLRGMIPGFAAGGLVGSYHGSVGGEGPWLQREEAATTRLIEKAVAAAAVKAIRAAQAAAASGPPGTYNTANLTNIGRYMFAHGYSKAAAAGIAGCVAGESGGNPLSAGSGGRGLIGWTPPSRLPDSAYIPGNPLLSFNRQLPEILKYNQIWAQFIPALNRIGDPVAAADFYSQFFERPAVTNSDVRPSVATSVFAALAAGTAAAAPGWAVTGERGPELVRMRGGETVLPASLTSRILSGGVAMPGYAAGTPDVSGGGGTGGGGGPSGGGRRGGLEADLRRKTAQLAAMQARASAQEKRLRIPVDRDELWLLEHPGAPAAQRKAREAELKRDRKTLDDYRKRAAADEAKIQREIRLLRAIIGRQHPGPPGKPPPGVTRGGGRKKELAELAARVKTLDALRKRTSAHLGALRRPLEEEQLYLLLHPGISAARRRAVEADIHRREAAVSRYRKTATAEESAYQREIGLLRRLTGEPAAQKYGGPGGAGGGTGGTKPPPHALPPPTFLTGAGGAGGFATGGAGVTPVSGSIVPLSGAAVPESTGPAASPAASAGGAGGADPQVITLLTSILAQLKAAPARTSAGVAQGVNGVGRTALNRGYYAVT